MKILYITENSDLDYLNNSIFHGLVSLFNNSVIDSNFLWYMSDCEYTNRIGINHLYGKGFTFGKSLYDRSKLDRSNILDKISDHYFDIIVYGSVWRNLDYINEVFSHYNSNEIIYLDGEDDEQIRFELLNKGFYFKRELSRFYFTQSIHVFPISFAIPKSKFKMINHNKTNKFFDSFKEENRLFDNEDDYYNKMNESFFASTRIKAGCDCLRHYEIIAAGCLPFFEKFEYMPKINMFNWPIDLQYQANTYFYHMNNFNQSVNKYYYFKLLNEFYQYALNHLTTIQLAKYILSRL